MQEPVASFVWTDGTSQDNDVCHRVAGDEKEPRVADGLGGSWWTGRDGGDHERRDERSMGGPGVTRPVPEPSPVFDELDPEWLRSRPGVKWHKVDPDVLPAWVADMDFPVPPPVGRALHRLIDSGDLGYPDWPAGTPLRRAFAERMSERYGWEAPPERVREITDLNQGLQMCLHLATSPGDAIAVHTPAYPPFLATVTGMGRQLVPIPMLEGPDRWELDADRFDHDAGVTSCRVLLLVNPHNPTGRVFTHAELAAIAEVAERRDLLVISDEIHAELAYPPHRHIPFASLSPSAARRTVTLMSATKAFNLAGIRCAIAHIGPDQLLASHDAQPPDLFGHVSVFGVAATRAAWTEAGAWLEEAVAHLDRNRLLVADSLAQLLPGIGYHLPEAGYLAWLDFRSLGLGADPAAVLLDRGRIALSHGPDFGPGGEGFARLNFATSRQVLSDVLDRLVRTVGPADSELV